MYLAVVLSTMLVLPLASAFMDELFYPGGSLIVVLGRWFVFWGVGVRLLLAGVRQVIQPQFTARSIFHMTSDEALPLVRELGIANIAIAIVAILSILVPSFVLPSALYGSIFYGIAGLRHAGETERSTNETIAMVSDLFIAVVLGAYVGMTLATRA